MKQQIPRILLALFLLATVMSGTAAAQTFEEDVSDPDSLTTGFAILIVGILAILTGGTVILNSPVALLGLGATFLFFLIAMLDLTSFRLFYIVATIQGLTLAATGVYDR